jgi:uncharacterized protein DUF2786
LRVFSAGARGRTPLRGTIARVKRTSRSTSILGRIKQLLALTESTNEHEARNAALLAAQLIRKHRIILSLPPSSPEPVVAETRPRPAPRRPSVRRLPKIDLPDEIVAPLGGECIHCGRRYRPAQTIYWFPAGGGIHSKCFEEWLDKNAE